MYLNNKLLLEKQTISYIVINITIIHYGGVLMNKKFSIATIMLATSLAFAGCSNTADNAKDAANDAETKVEETANEAADKANEVAEDAKDKAEEAKEDANEAKEDAKEAAEDTKDDVKEEVADTTNPDELGNVVLHRAYPKDMVRSFTTVVVATSGDKIVGALLDEYQIYDKDSDYKGVPNSDAAFGEGVAEGKIIGSKIDNKEPYSADMKAAGGEITLMDNYNAVTDFVKGKTITELEDFLNDNDEEAIMDAISGATFHSTPNLVKMIVDTAKDNTFIAGGNATNPDDIEIRYTLGAPHGERGFGNAVVAVEGDTIIASSIDEYQFLEDGIGLPGSEGGFGEGYADSKVVLGSKLENNDSYSALMAEKAKSTISIKDNYQAIEKYVSGKTVDEIKELIANATPGEGIDEVSGATLKDTAGYLQLIVDAFEKDIIK